ncbi:MAG TPA: response regulator [Steroidobacteraceae bacterium]
MKRILFVDDEVEVLDGLRARLHNLAGSWEMCFVGSGERALQELERGVFDVVVTDMRMPRMDGAELLSRVRDRWPDVVRIVLSGYSESGQILRLVPYAHQYLSKPCEPRQLESVIERCLRLHQLLRQQSLRRIVGRIERLPAMPRVYTQLRTSLANEMVSAHDIGEIVAADPVIAAKVLQLVNSAFFRLARRITNIEQAVSYLGFTAIRNLTLSVELFSQWPAVADASGLDLESLQAHVHLVAGATRALAGGSAVTPDDALLVGLLHDFGYWILAQECAAELAGSVALAQRERIPLYEAEKIVIGASHAEIGAYLLGIWGLPYSVIDAVAYHHLPGSTKPSEFDLLAALAVAQALVPTDDSDAFAGDLVPDPRVDAEYLGAHQAPFSWEDAENRVRESLQAEEHEP